MNSLLFLINIKGIIGVEFVTLVQSQTFIRVLIILNVGGLKEQIKCSYFFKTYLVFNENSERLPRGFLVLARQIEPSENRPRPLWKGSYS